MNNNLPRPPSVLVTVAEAAALLHIGKRTVWRWIRLHKLQPVRLGRITRLRRADLEHPVGLEEASLTLNPEMMAMSDQRCLLRIREVQELLAVCRGTVNNLLRKGLLKKVKIGKATRVRRKDVMDLVEGTPRARQGQRWNRTAL